MLLRLVPAAVACLLIFVGCSSSPVAPTTLRECAPPYPTGAPTVETVFCTDPATLEAATTLRIIDGDTLDVRIGSAEERVRLFGVDTPERGEPCFREATDRLRALASDGVLLRADARNRDPNGRLLRYVYTRDGVSIDALLVAEGFAYAWTRDGAAREALIALEAGARDAGQGCLWHMTKREVAGTIGLLEE